MAASDNISKTQFKSAYGEYRHELFSNPDDKPVFGSTRLSSGGRKPGVLASEGFDPKHFPNMPAAAMNVLQNDGYDAFIDKYGPLTFPGKRGTF